MSRGVEVRQELMKSTIRVVAEQGIQNATTKALSIDSNLGEVYIYRHFKSKDHLFRETFESLDKELMWTMLHSIRTIDKTKADVRIGFKSVFHDFWRFCLSDKNKCSFFIQYYYSSYYLEHSETERKLIYKPLLEVIFPAFKKDVDVWMELNHMYDIVFPKLLRVIRGTMPDSNETEESVYREIMFVEEQNILWSKVFDVS